MHGIWIVQHSAFFFSYVRKMPQQYIKTGPGRFLSSPFQFIFHNDPMSRTTKEVKPWFTQTIQPGTREVYVLFRDSVKFDWRVLYGCGLLKITRVIVPLSRKRHHLSESRRPCLPADICVTHSARGTIRSIFSNGI
jgi:hypothetical protein